ncbi:hypothetical protein D8B23_14715 [Verminephrobacter aporrectodeae subsp. tuberculatae]|nr:hypothetical protein [Verminephrobacter aporrectodeae subsp. tuberculatae]
MPLPGRMQIRRSGPGNGPAHPPPARPAPGPAIAPAAPGHTPASPAHRWPGTALRRTIPRGQNAGSRRPPCNARAKRVPACARPSTSWVVGPSRGS